MNKEKILKILRELGFFSEEIEGLGFQIEYEWLKILVTCDDEGLEINLVVPHIYDVTGENRTMVNRAIANLCGMVKYAQAYVSENDHVYINYLHYLGENEPTKKLVEHMVTVVAFATSKFHEIMNAYENKR